jgi:hypothetical protein
MSYSFREPEWPADCECKYDEARDEMDRDDCPLHCDQIKDSESLPKPPLSRKPSGIARSIKESAA